MPSPPPTRRLRDFGGDPRSGGPRPRHRAAVHPPGRGDRCRARREDVVVVTPTASGKSLCYTLPVLQAITEDAASRALYLFPTKALGQDQVAELARADQGRRPRRRRRRRTTATRRAHPVGHPRPRAGSWSPTRTCSHSAILPHHTKWFQLFEQLRYVVVDELHTYRGVFGSHVANVLRRLLRICAPLRQPAGHRVLLRHDRQPAGAGRAPDRPPVRLSTGTAPRPAKRHVAARRPAGPRPSTGARGSAAHARRALALPFLRAGRQTIVFGRARTSVEIITRPARGAARELRAAQPRPRLPRRVPADRAPRDRAGLREGEISASSAPTRWSSASTSGGSTSPSWRATRAPSPATWQQIGRAGRRGGPASASVIVASAPRSTSTSSTTPSSCSTPRRRRRASTRTTCTSCWPTCGPRRSSCRSSPARCSDRRRSTTSSRSSPRKATSARPATAAGTGSSENFPASEISMRAAAPENVVIIDTTPDRPAGPRRGRPVLGAGARPRNGRSTCTSRSSTTSTGSSGASARRTSTRSTPTTTRTRTGR